MIRTRKRFAMCFRKVQVLFDIFGGLQSNNSMNTSKAQQLGLFNSMHGKAALHNFVRA